MTDEGEAPLNKKDITEEITGGRFNFDDDEAEETAAGIGEPEAEEGLNQVVGILDMMITSTPSMLVKRGYPAPNLEIWETWGKENLSKAFNAYMPAAAGNTISSPAFCGILGLGAMILCFLPVILHFIDKRTAATESADDEKRQAPDPKPEAARPQEYEDKYEEPVGVSREPTKSTAAISSGPTKAAWDRINEVIAAQK